jgi:peptide/nickel transport system substrate-binding protein
VALLAAAAPAASYAARDGGEITISETLPPDFLDPALSYTVNGWEPMWLVYTPLLTYDHAEGAGGAKLIPALAESLPQILRGGRRYELRLRPGLRYSDGTPVKASDFEHAIKRVVNMESGGDAFFLGIKGARRYHYGGRAGGDISGIRADDATGTITIDLVAPDGTFSHELAMLFAAPVPSTTPFRDMTRAPPPGVGPYRITSSIPGRELVLERMRTFDVPGIPPGHVDKITIRVMRSKAAQGRAVLDGTVDYMQDMPPPAIREEARRRGLYEEHPASSTYYMFMNSRRPPFDDARVRRAVNYGVDKRALVRVFEGNMRPGCSLLAPGVPGYSAALDQSGCPWGDPSRPPKLAKARRLIRAAGAVGAKVTVWGDDDDPTDDVTAAYARQLRRLGLDARARIVDGGIYFQVIGNARTKAQTGFANWFEDFPHPYNFFFLVDGRTIQPNDNQNFGNVDDPRINRVLRVLKREPTLSAHVVRRWAALDRRLVRAGHLFAYGHSIGSTFMSERMDIEHCSVFHPLFANDYSSWCLE